MTYVDGYLLPLPKKNVPAYRRMAKQAAKIWREHEDELSAIKRTVQSSVPRPREVEEHGRFHWRHFPRQSVHLAVGVLVAQRLLNLADVHDVVCDRPEAAQPRATPGALRPAACVSAGRRSGSAFVESNV